MDYQSLDQIEDFATRRRRQFQGKVLRAERLTGFCLLASRDLLQSIGGFDERFAVGFFEDDDLSVRALNAGFDLLVALDVFVHHFGNRTFAGLGLDGAALLKKNFELFRQKWGDAQAAGYQVPAQSDAVAARLPTVSEATDAVGSMYTQQRAAGLARPRVSLTMIVKNEEKNLPACLASVADLVDELIVVDTGSSDATVELARNWGAKISHFPWIDNFAAARNEALRHATGEWVFWMDADDRLDEDNRCKLRNLVADLPNEPVGFVMKCVCLPDPQTGTSTVVDHIRLFPNDPGMRWEYRIHEQILPSLRRQGVSVRWCDVVIQHVGYQDAEVRRRKLERDVRLLQMENQERPDDPFTLFNLGMVQLEQDLPEQARECFERSLRRSQPTDSIVRKLYSLLSQTHRLLGDYAQARRICQEGRVHYPDDPEILCQESLALQKLGDPHRAIACLKQMLEAKGGPYFASVDTALRGFKGHHNLATLYLETGQWQDAEQHWKKSLAQEPAYLPALVGLGELYLRLNRAADFENVLRKLEGQVWGHKELLLLRARWLLKEKQFGPARAAMTAIIEEFPDFVQARVVLSYILLQEGRDAAAAERVLREILAREPSNDEARRNLEILKRQLASAHENSSALQ